MDKEGVVRFLKAIGAKQIQAGSGKWVGASCPLAPWTHSSGKDSHPSFAVVVNPEAPSKYNCFTCGSGTLFGLVQQLSGHGVVADFKTALELIEADENQDLKLKIKDWDEQSPLQTDDDVVFSEVWLNSFPRAIDCKSAREYLHKRGLSDAMIKRLDARYDYELETVAFPVRDFHGVLRGLRGRRMNPTDDQPRYHNYRSSQGKYSVYVWYGESWVSFDKPIIMCESLFDTASLLRVYSNVVAPMTTGVNEGRWKRMSPASEVVLFFDNDKAGDKARADAKRYLKGAIIQDVFPPEGSDPGEMSEQDLRTLLKYQVKLDS